MPGISRRHRCSTTGCDWAAGTPTPAIEIMTAMSAPVTRFTPLRWVNDLSERSLVSILIFLTFIIRLVATAQYPTEWDSVQLFFGMDRFDLTQHSPHPPGYWLYIAAARLIRAISPLDGHQSLVVLAAAASAGAVGLAYICGRELGGRWLGFGAGFFLLTSPFMWFYGSIAGTYSFDALVALALILLAIRSHPGGRHGIAAAAVLGLGAGLRPTVLVLLGPIAAVALIRSKPTWSKVLLAGLAGIASLAVWIVPMILEQPGGVAMIRLANSRHWADTVVQTSILYGAPSTGITYNIGQATAYSLAAIHLVAFFPLFRLFGRRSYRTAFTWLLLLVVIPSLLFVFLFHFGKAGYVLVYLPALVILLLRPAAATRGFVRFVATFALVAVCLINFERFWFGEGVLTDCSRPSRLWLTDCQYGAPYGVTRTNIESADSDYLSLLELQQIFDPDREVLVFVWLNGGHLWRHAMLGLPDFEIYLVRPGKTHLIGWERLQREEAGERILIPPDGQAVLILDSDYPELSELAARGLAEKIYLSSGRGVWMVQPGAEVAGVLVETNS